MRLLKRAKFSPLKKWLPRFAYFVSRRLLKIPSLYGVRVKSLKIFRRNPEKIKLCDLKKAHYDEGPSTR